MVYEVKCAQKAEYQTLSKFDSKNFTTVIRLFFILQTDEGNVLFEEKIESDPISLIYGPIFDVVSHTDYVYVNESIILPISFAN